MLNDATGLKLKGHSIAEMSGWKKQSSVLFDTYNRNMRCMNQEKLEIAK